MSGPAHDPQPHDTEAAIRADRLAKVDALRDAGVEPYPNSFGGRTSAESVRARHGELPADTEAGETVRLAGRVMGRRGHGKAMFLDLVDGSGRIQLQATADATPRYDELKETDLGDLLGIEGDVFSTRRGELTVRVREWTLLAKALRPLPEKWHGLTDTEQRYRHRYLDLMVNEESRQDALARSRVITSMRRVLDAEGFVEVETPVLQPIYGGALARPFTTHHNELDRTFYLRIATELYLKRLIVAGLERVYEIGRDFRNEGVSFKHNPEFTMLEWYQAYTDYRDGMNLTERVVAAAGEAAGTELDLSPPWRRIPLRDAIIEHAGIDALADRDAGRLKRFMEERGVDHSADHTWAQAVDHVLSHFVEPNLTDPTFLTDYPVELSPFAKRSPSDPGLVERFEAFAAGVEIANGYSELNDPVDQRARFEEAVRAREAGDEEAPPIDEDYLLAMEYGMPPTCGVGIGIDRLVMLLRGKRSIREIILFPALRDRV
jgi:lysyl-tRNA synthetase class 2